VPRVASVCLSDFGGWHSASLNRSFGVTTKVQRLRTRSQFQAVLTGGIVARTAHFAMHRADLSATAVDSKTAPAAKRSTSTQGSMCIGAQVPKRLAKRAVTRNAIKRQIYSIGTDFQSNLPAAAHVIRLRADFDSRQFYSANSDRLKSLVREELQQLFKSAAIPRSSEAQST
jgi:ribonuclease P protein component